MKPVQEAVRQAGIDALLAMGCAVHKISGGKAPKHLFMRNVEHKKIGTKVKIVSQNEDTTFIAKYNPDGTISDEDFTIVVATDLHIDRDISLINKTLEMLVKHLEDVKPDLLILTGDIIVTDYQQIDSVQFAKMMEEIGIYWAFVFGNHEARAEKEFHKFFMLKNKSRYEHCLTKFGPPELFGYGNFIVNIMSGENTISQSLVFMDSGRDITDKYRKEYSLPADFKGYDFIKENQIQWYEKHIAELKQKYGDVKSMLFMHIPIPEYEEVMRFDPDAKPVPTGIPTGKGEIIYGEMHESVGCSPYNSGLFERAKAVGAQAFFAGHDHINDYHAVYQGVHLVYVQMGGYEIYHMGNKYNYKAEDCMQGVTVLTIKKDGDFTLKQNLTRKFLDKKK